MARKVIRDGKAEPFQSKDRRTDRLSALLWLDREMAKIKTFSEEDDMKYLLEELSDFERGSQDWEIVANDIRAAILSPTLIFEMKIQAELALREQVSKKFGHTLS